MAFDKGILHFWSFAKYAVAFPDCRAPPSLALNWARKRAISISSAFTPGLPLTSFSVGPRCALTQFDSVCSTTSRLRAASAMPCPDSTSRLDFSLYLPRFPSSSAFPFHYYSTSSRDTSCRARSDRGAGSLDPVQVLGPNPTTLSRRAIFMVKESSGGSGTASLRKIDRFRNRCCCRHL